MLYIFDWDGTVCDSTAKIVNCMQRSCEDAGVDVPDDESCKNIIGLGLKEAMDTLFPAYDEGLRETIRHGYSHHFLKDDTGEQTPLFESVLDVLEDFKAQGMLLAVATGKSRAGLERMFDNLSVRHLFHASRCADETASKPSPKMLIELLDELNIPVTQSVMVGDTEYDMDMAKQIDMPRIAVSYGAHHIDRLKPYEPALCMDHFSEIRGFEF